MSNFLVKRRVGHIAEKEVYKLLQVVCSDVEISDREIGFDITAKFLDQPFSVEVKFDKMEAQTGNVALEFFNPKQSQFSGILATKADIWCHVLLREPNLILMARTKDLFLFIKNNQPTKVIGLCGDSNSAIILYPTKLILQKSPFVSVTTKNIKNSLKKLLQQ